MDGDFSENMLFGLEGNFMGSGDSSAECHRDILIADEN
jgi:hypothetical protein